MSKEFLNSIESPNIVKDGVIFFDELMILYNLIGIKEDIKISIVNDIHKYTFNLRFIKEEDCQRLYQSLNNMDYTVYGKRFSIIMSQIDSLNLGVLIVGT